MTIVYKPKDSEFEELINYNYVQGIFVINDSVIARLADGTFVTIASDLTPEAAKEILNKIKIGILDKDRIVGLL